MTKSGPAIKCCNVICQFVFKEALEFCIILFLYALGVDEKQ
jgi:hypothetical protein